MSLPLLFPGVPGGVELLVLFLVMALFLIVPVALIGVAYLLGKRRGGAGPADEETDG